MKFIILVAFICTLILNAESQIIARRVLFGPGIPTARIPVVIAPTPIVRVAPVARLALMAPVLPLVRAVPIVPVVRLPVAGLGRIFKRSSEIESQNVTAEAAPEEVITTESVPDLATESVPDLATESVPDLATDSVPEVNAEPPTNQTFPNFVANTTEPLEPVNSTSEFVETSTVSISEKIVPENKTAANCSIVNDLLNCTGEVQEHNFECEVIPQLAHLQNVTIDVANLIIKPELIKNHESLRLLMKVPAERFSITNATVRAYTFINHRFNQTKETLSIYSSQNLTNPGFRVKDHECFSQLVSLAKNILVEQFRIFVYLHHASTLF